MLWFLWDVVVFNLLCVLIPLPRLPVLCSVFHAPV